MTEDTAAIAALIMAAAGLLTAAGIAIRALANRLTSDVREAAGRDHMLSSYDDLGGASTQTQSRFGADTTRRYAMATTPAPGLGGQGYAQAEPRPASPLESVVQRLEGVVLNMQSYATHEDIRRLEEQIARLSNKVDDYAADVVDHRRTSDRLARTMAALRHQILDLEARHDRGRVPGASTEPSGSSSP